MDSAARQRGDGSHGTAASETDAEGGGEELTVGLLADERGIVRARDEGIHRRLALDGRTPDVVIAQFREDRPELDAAAVHAEVSGAALAEDLVDLDPSSRIAHIEPRIAVARRKADRRRRHLHR